MTDPAVVKIATTCPTTLPSVAPEAAGFSGAFRTFKHNHLFIVEDVNGSIPANNMTGLGFYCLDTRHLSRYEIFINDIKPMTLLTSNDSSSFSTIVYTNNQAECKSKDERTILLPQETILIKRESCLNDNLFERFTLTNYNAWTSSLKLTFIFDADFRDIFDARAKRVTTEGKLLDRKIGNADILFTYRDGLGHSLSTAIVFKDIQPVSIESVDDCVIVVVEIDLPPQETHSFYIDITPTQPDHCRPTQITNYEQAYTLSNRQLSDWSDKASRIETDNKGFNEILNRSVLDVRMLETRISQDDNSSSFIAAGIPWYVSLFGRDSLITARNCLILKPDIARNTLNILAEYQGNDYDDWKDEEPGKILHELRLGELARHRKIPHAPYYGSVDATPLWLILLYEYYLWTKDEETLNKLWPNAVRAMDWIDRSLANNPLGYLGYKTKSDGGLYHQCWKDSHDSMMYENGQQAEPPLYLVEVQGYVYRAKKCFSRLAREMDQAPLAQRQSQEAIALKKRFNKDFWIHNFQFLAMALDKEGKPLQVVSSNAGHALEMGILNPAYNNRVSQRLMAKDMFNGFGIRTISDQSVSYNPMSYHNGSVWPHDTAIVAKGMVSSGNAHHSEQLFDALNDVGRLVNLYRYPELFCGFERDYDRSDPPVRYPMACSPQAWAASSVFSMLQSALNIYPKALDASLKSALIIKKPHLPKWLHHLEINNMLIGQSRVSLAFDRTDKNVTVNVLNRDKDTPIYIEI